MANKPNQTVETGADVAAFVAKVDDAGQRGDAETLVALMARVSGTPARMWGPAIIGFGSYHYRYESGREGDMPRIAFSPRKGKTVLYGLASQFGALDGLGKHATSKGCLYVKRLSDIDLAMLERLFVGAWASFDERHPG